MILQIQQGLKEDGCTVLMTKLCRWFNVSRRTVYHKPAKAKPKVKGRFAGPSKQMTEAEPSVGYWTAASLLRFNKKNAVQRVFELMGWQVRKRSIGHRPRIEALPSVVTTPNQRLVTDLCRVWSGRNGLQALAPVIDCDTRELLAWQLSRSGGATPATAALEQALIARLGSLRRDDRSFLLRSDNALVFTSRTCTRMARSEDLRQEVITPYCPQQNGLIERVIRTLKEQCLHRHRFEIQQYASRVIGKWIRFCNTRRLHQAVGIKVPAMA
jgi:putative transposase